jgi:hypothetical protein
MRDTAADALDRAGRLREEARALVETAQIVVAASLEVTAEARTLCGKMSREG